MLRLWHIVILFSVFLQLWEDLSSSGLPPSETTSNLAIEVVQGFRLFRADHTGATLTCMLTLPMRTTLNKAQ